VPLSFFHHGTGLSYNFLAQIFFIENFLQTCTLFDYQEVTGLKGDISCTQSPTLLPFPD